jgi:hypothetical protein
MKKRKYAYMIVGCDKGLMIGMEVSRNEGRFRISNRLSWLQIENAKCDIVEVQLDIMEAEIDKRFSPHPDPTTFEEIFGTPE